MAQGIPYRHLHVHQLFATMDVTTQSGEAHRIIDRGRLTAFDDAEVRRLAEQRGDPDHLLTEAWVPQVPGVTTPGSIEDYLRDPASVVYRTAH